MADLMVAVLANLLLLVIVTAAFEAEIASYNETNTPSYIALNPSDIEIELGQSEKLFVKLMKPLQNRTNFTFTYRDSSGGYFIVSKKLPIKPLDSFIIESGSNATYQTNIYANKPGTLKLGITSPSFNISDLDLVHTSITVYRLKWLIVIQQIVGWIYFLAWTLSFYPQIILNCRRKSVIGLSFDFIAYNVIGFLCYSIFNIGLYFVSRIQDEYFKIYPLGVNPVQLNDLFFSVHALLITLVVVVQCVVYHRGSQRVSNLCKVISLLMVLFIGLSSLLAIINSITWLSALYLFSYVKLLVTLIKYVPQAILNCRRQSCVGWSLGNVTLDFVGGIFSIAQMFIIAYNCDDWGSVFGSPTKLGLGLVSVSFDVFFFIQHHVYRQRNLGTRLRPTGDASEEGAPLVGDENEIES
ncbi:hypothetical protein Aperf_G00000117995 [Anoplocephala perfoliata]